MKLSNSTACPLWPQHPSRCTTVLAVQKTFGSLSIIGCLFVMLIIIVLKTYKAYVQKLIFSLAFSAFFESVSYVIGNIYTKLSHSCRFQAFFMQYFDMATLLWVLVIAVNLLLVVHGKNLQKHFLFVHIFVWLFALFWAVIPFFGNNYGPAGIWCWIVRDNIALRFGVWYGPLFFICLCMVVIYAYITVKVIQSTKPQSASTDGEIQVNKAYRDELKPLMSYPLIFILFYIPAFMYRIEDAIHEDDPPNFALTILSVIFVPAIGATNAITFAFFNATVKELTWLKFKISILAFFSSEQPHVIHRDYAVEDAEAISSGSASFYDTQNSINANTA